jgi:hypothetical protein
VRGQRRDRAVADWLMADLRSGPEVPSDPAGVGAYSLHCHQGATRGTQRRPDEPSRAWSLASRRDCDGALACNG